MAGAKQPKAASPVPWPVDVLAQVRKELCGNDPSSFNFVEEGRRLDVVKRMPNGIRNSQEELD